MNNCNKKYKIFNNKNKIIDIKKIYNKNNKYKNINNKYKITNF